MFFNNVVPFTEPLLDGVLLTARGGDGDELVPHQPRARLPAVQEELRRYTPAITIYMSIHRHTL